MKTWDEMEPRERDAWVAEHVMGWRDVDDGKFMAKWKGFDEDSGKVLWDQTDHSGIPPRGGCRDFIPHCTTDAAADYLVLERVRETWRAEQKEEFSSRVWSILAHRGYDDVDYHIGYQPGDYSQAAYLALTGGE